MKIKKVICTAVAVLVCLTAGITVQASSRENALKAYNKMLSKSTIKWNDKYNKEPTSKLKFALIDFDQNGTPELYVEKDLNSGVDNSFQIYSYNGQRITKIFSGESRESLTSYYPGRKLITVTRYDRAGVIKTFYSVSTKGTKARLSTINPYGSTPKYYSGKYYYGTKITKKQFNKIKKSLVKNNVANNKIYTKSNTAANRKKYLSMKNTTASLKIYHNS